MLKKVGYIVILTMVLAGASLFSLGTLQGRVASTSGNILLVGPDFPYQSIQQAVNNASNGDIIEVFNASTPYYENVVVNKSVIIRPYSQNHISPTIVGGFNVTSPDVEIDSLVIRDRGYGILLNSSGNTITGNTITNESDGLNVAGSSNMIANNTIINNFGGLYVGGNSNILRNNTMSGNVWNFGMNESAPAYQDIDKWNTVNGKPIYYWVNRTGGSIPNDTGYACIVNSTGVTVENLVLQNNYEGIQVAYSSQITIRNCSTVYGSNFDNTMVLVNASYSNIENSDLEVGTVNNYVIWLLNSNDNILGGNTIAAHVSDGAAMRLDESNNNEIANNVISGADTGPHGGAGIGIVNSSQDVVVANNISSTYFALDVVDSGNVTFFHNNFVQPIGINFAEFLNSSVRCDNGYEGNYYSNFAGIDLNGDGIIDTNYTVGLVSGGIYIDNCPLVQPWSAVKTFNRNMTDSTGHSKTITVQNHPISTLQTNSNSTLASFNYTKYAFTLNATCGYDGFLNVTIPRNWIDGPFNVTIDKAQVAFDVKQDENYSYIHINYAVGSHMIQILGARAGNIPGDLNGDGIVSLVDLVILAQNYGGKAYP